VGIDNTNTPTYIGKKKAENRNFGDFYPTPPLGTYSLVKYHNIPSVVYEPAAGRGHISYELERMGIDTISTDLHEHPNPRIDHIVSGIDFLSVKAISRTVRSIVTNPPYGSNLPEKFIHKSLSFPEVDVIAMLCRGSFLHSQGRYKRLYKDIPPTKILIFTGRIHFNEKACDELDTAKQSGGMIDYAWYVWDRRISSKTTECAWIDTECMVKQRNREVLGVTTNTLSI